MVTIISKLNPNHPSTIAAVPTPLFTLPFPKSCATCAAATELVCCHSTLTSTKMEATKMRASATWDTGREGKGLMSTSLPVRASCSSCQPGKVARRRMTMKARTMPTMLRGGVSMVSYTLGENEALTANKETLPDSCTCSRPRLDSAGPAVLLRSAAPAASRYCCTGSRRRCT